MKNDNVVILHIMENINAPTIIVLKRKYEQYLVVNIIALQLQQ